MPMSKPLKRIFCAFLAILLTFSPLPVRARAADAEPSGRVSDLISVALSQLDYEEGENNYTKYGVWYNIPHGAWCDMFVSWCANEAGISTAVLPRSAGCTTHIRLLKKCAPYYLSASRGGAYTPKQGDLIFFYSPLNTPDGSVSTHIGIVLCVENGCVFTIEGNTCTIREDYPYYDRVYQLFDDGLDPTDYVAVKHYSLQDLRIHGYATPDYADLTAYPNDEWVDLGKYEDLRPAFQALVDAGIISETSSYTFSPRYGMTRGEFLQSVMTLYGLSGWDEETTEEFLDVPQDSTYYDAAMTARCAGIVNGTGRGLFTPDVYISASGAQAILSRTLAYVGQEDRSFSFSPGDTSYMLTSYTIRADLAAALYALLSQMPTPTGASFQLTLNGEPLDAPALVIDRCAYVPLDRLLQTFPALEAATPDPWADRSHPLPVPMAHTDRVLLTQQSLQSGDATADVPSFRYHGTQYVMLRPAAELLGVASAWSAEDNTVALTWSPAPAEREARETPAA